MGSDQEAEVNPAPESLETNANGDRPAVAEPKAKRRAGADFSQTKDEAEAEEDDDGTGAPGEFTRADQETMAKRRIVKARRPSAAPGASASDQSGAPASNPFSGISLAPAATTATTTAPPPANTSTAEGEGEKKSVFGSAFPKVNASNMLAAAGAGGGGWGAAPTGAAGFAAYKSTNPFQFGTGSGEGKSPSPFSTSPTKAQGDGAPKPFSGGFGAATGAKADGEDDDVSPEDLEAEPTGTFKVPQVQGLMDPEFRPANGEEGEECVLQVRGKLYKLTDKTPRDWQECGKGLAKLLVSKAEEGKGVPSSRMVMRRESVNTVILNVRLRKPLEAAKQADKALRLTCIDSGKPATFLLTLGTKEDAENLLKQINDRVASANAAQQSSE